MTPTPTGTASSTAPTPTPHGANPPGADGPAAAPAITRLKLTPSRFAAARSGASIAKKRKAPVGTSLSYTIDQASITTVTIARVRPGTTKGAKCVKRKKGAKGKACSRLTTVGKLSHADAAGAITFRFTGRLKGKALRVGTYRLQVQGVNAKGSGAAVTRRFRISDVLRRRVARRPGPLEVEAAQVAGDVEHLADEVQARALAATPSSSTTPRGCRRRPA